MEDIKVEFAFKPSQAGNTRGTIVAKSGKQILLVNTINLGREKARSKFIETLFSQCPGLENDEIRKKLDHKLLCLAAQQIDRNPNEQKDSNNDLCNQPLYKSKTALEETEPKLIECAREFLNRIDLVSRIIRHTQLLGVAGEDELIFTLYIIGTSRLLPRPLAGLVMGVSAAGKSYVINQTSQLFPEEVVIQAHRMTPRALEYMPAGALKHCFVVAGERSRLQKDEAAEATRALREMISDGKLRLVIPVKKASGELESKIIEQDGPIAYVESTTLGINEIFNEDRTRFVLLSSNERKQQTIAIIHQMAGAVSKPSDPDHPDSIIGLHHTAQRLLQPVQVIIPYADQLTECLPHERIEVRRSFGHMLSFIQAVALLHQYQRQRNDKGHVIATVEDYEIVRQYLAGPLARSLGRELTPGAADLLEYVREYGRFSIPEISGKLQCSDNTVRSRIKELVRTGQIQKMEESIGSKAAVYASVDDPPPLEGLKLPKLTEMENKNSCIRIHESVADNA